MSLLSEIRERLRAFVFRRREERALEEELAFHLEMETKENLRRGLSPEEARRRAHVSLGGTEVVREWVRDARGSRPLEDLVRDAALGFRMLGKRKEFSVVMLTVLALGIGANTATFSVVEALLLRELPVVHPHRLVAIGDPTRTGSLSVGSSRTDIASYPLYVDVRDGNTVFDGLYASGRTGRLDVLVSEPGAADAQAEPEHPAGRFVSGEFFGVLGMTAQLGRVFGPADDELAAPSPVVVASHRYWQTRLDGGDVIGRTLVVNDVPLTLIGVTPEGFSGDIVGQPVDLWIPLTLQPVLQPHTPFLDQRPTNWLLMMGRLADGTTLEQARAEVHALEARSLTDNVTVGNEETVAQLLREEPAAVGSGARGFSFYRASLGRPLLTLMAAVGLVLLVACANVASLTMVRATTRTREMGLRIALGAGRSRVLRQLLAESLVVAALGGALGLLLARWGITLLLRVATPGARGLPLDARLSAGVLVFTAALTLGTAVLFGIVPALRGSRATADLKGRGITGRDGGKGHLPGGRALVVAQVALSTVLLVGTGMLVRSVAKLQQVDLGFDRDRTLVATIDAARSGYEGEALATLRREITRRLGALPGVGAVSYSENGIFSGTESGTTLQMEGFTATNAEDTSVAYDDVGPGYFAAIGAQMLQGRDIEERDGEAAPRVAVVNETMSRFFFADGSAIGRRVTVDQTSYEIVGIVADAEQQGVREEPVRRLYLPMSQLGADVPGRINLVALAGNDPAAVVDPIRRELRAIDPNLTVLSVDPVSSLISGSISQDRMLMRVLTFFGALAMLLAAVGLFGLMAFGAARRSSEFGLRMALGAQRATLTRMMLVEALALVTLGVLAGVPAALAATTLIRSQIYGIDIVDPPSVVLAVALLLAAALIAGGIPAVRAGRVSPLESLRAE